MRSVFRLFLFLTDSSRTRSARMTMSALLLQMTDEVLQYDMQLRIKMPKSWKVLRFMWKFKCRKYSLITNSTANRKAKKVKQIQEARLL